jgi:hypothetical protein
MVFESNSRLDPNDSNGSEHNESKVDDRSDEHYDEPVQHIHAKTIVLLVVCLSLASRIERSANA